MLAEKSKQEIPADYHCSCGAHGCKMWREYQSVSPELKCARCAAEDQGKDISDMNEGGKRTAESGCKTDTIGWYVPAVPAENGGYWGYSSVPQTLVDWWKGLPNHPE